MKSIVQVNQRIDFFLPEFLLIVLKMPMLAFQTTLMDRKQANLSLITVKTLEFFKGRLCKKSCKSVLQNILRQRKFILR